MDGYSGPYERQTKIVTTACGTQVDEADYIDHVRDCDDCQNERLTRHRM